MKEQKTLEQCVNTDLRQRFYDILNEVKIAYEQSMTSLSAQEHFTSPQWLFEGHNPDQDLDVKLLISQAEQFVEANPIFKMAVSKLCTVLLGEIEKLMQKELSPQEKANIYQGICKVLVFQGPGSSYPKIYHTPKHTFNVVTNIIVFLSKNDEVRNFLHADDIFNVLITALNHDTVLYLNYSGGSGFVNKYGDNEILSVSELTGSPQILNPATQVQAGNFAEGKLIQVNQLNDILRETNNSLQTKVLAFLLVYFDTCSKTAIELVANATKVWMEEVAVKIVCNHISSLEDNEHALKLEILNNLNGISTLRQFNQVLKVFFYSNKYKDLDVLYNDLYKSLKKFISLQSVIAHNFSTNAREALEIMKANTIKAEDSKIVERLMELFITEDHYPNLIMPLSLINISTELLVEANFGNLILWLEDINLKSQINILSSQLTPLCDAQILNPKEFKHTTGAQIVKIISGLVGDKIYPSIDELVTAIKKRNSQPSGPVFV